MKKLLKDNLYIGCNIFLTQRTHINQHKTLATNDTMTTMQKDNFSQIFMTHSTQHQRTILFTNCILFFYK